MAKWRALIVEDNAETSGALQEAFSFWGYDTDVAEDPQQGMTMAEARWPDVVVMDGDPGALDAIRSFKATDPRVFVVVFTGWPHMESASRAAGADAFIVKPDFDGLERAVNARTK